MSIEAAFASLLTDNTLVGLCTGGIAMVMAPQNTQQAPPYLVWTPSSGVPQRPIAAQGAGGMTLLATRIQCDVYARTVAEVLAIQAALNAAVEFKYGTIGGVRIVSCVRALLGPWGKDVESRLLYRSVDYMVTHYDD